MSIVRKTRIRIRLRQMRNDVPQQSLSHAARVTAPFTQGSLRRFRAIASNPERFVFFSRTFVFLCLTLLQFNVIIHPTYFKRNEEEKAALFPCQRAAGWCEGVRAEAVYWPPSGRSERYFPVGRTGSAR